MLDTGRHIASAQNFLEYRQFLQAKHVVRIHDEGIVDVQPVDEFQPSEIDLP